MSTHTKRNYAVDKTRVQGNTEDTIDPEAPDAVWVPIVSPNRDECNSPEARTDALRFVSQLGLGVATGIDREDGPEIDSGRMPFVFNADRAFNQGVTSAEEYLRSAAHQKLQGATGNSPRYVTFYRVRRDQP